MFELASGLLGSLFGGLFRLAPEIIKFLDRKDERRHELSMFTLQTDLESFTRRVIDGIFFWDDNHCYKAMLAERQRLQVPPELR